MGCLVVGFGVDSQKSGDELCVLIPHQEGDLIYSIGS